MSYRFEKVSGNLLGSNVLKIPVFVCVYVCLFVVVVVSVVVFVLLLLCCNRCLFHCSSDAVCKVNPRYLSYCRLDFTPKTSFL